MTTVRNVTLYFDVISPYSWLALGDAEPFAARHGVRWEVRPVVYGAILDATGLVGPAETTAKRRYTFHDVARVAHRLGRRLVGPPAHPFRSLEALRTVCLHQDDPGALRLARALADAAWGGGRDLTDPEVLVDVVVSAGFPGEDLLERVDRPEVKERLRRNTEGALERGVFGVPSFWYEGELFWGQDRMTYLADRLQGRGPDPTGISDAILRRPRGADRRKAPRPPEN